MFSINPLLKASFRLLTADFSKFKDILKTYFFGYSSNFLMTCNIATESCQNVNKCTYFLRTQLYLTKGFCCYQPNCQKHLKKS